mgnify:CR=1 FL=1
MSYQNKKLTIQQIVFNLLQDNDLTQWEMFVCTGVQYTSLGPTFARLLRQGKIEFYETGRVNAAGGPERKYRKATGEGSQEHADFIARGVEIPSQVTVKKWCSMQVSETALFWAWALSDRSKINAIFNHEVMPC